MGDTSLKKQKKEASFLVCEVVGVIGVWCERWRREREWDREALNGIDALNELGQIYWTRGENSLFTEL